MNTAKLVSVLLGAAAAVVLIVVLVLFIRKRGGPKPEEPKPAEPESKAAAEVPAHSAAAGVLNVVTFMRDSNIESMRNLVGSYLLDARAKTSYQSVGQMVTVVSSDLEDAPGYTKLTHTLASPFKGTEVVFDGVSRLPTFEHPVASLAAYWWQSTLLFLTFKTVNQTGQTAATKFYHFSANRTELGLRWSRLMMDHTNDLDLAVLAEKLDEVNTLFSNVVALHLDEYLEESTGTYTSEFGGLPTAVTLSKRPFTQAGFMKVTHKLLMVGSDVARTVKLKKVLVSGPLTALSVYWWHNTPLLAELDLLGGRKDHFVYNLDVNNWLNEPVEKVRSTLTLLKNNLGVPLTMDLGKKGVSADVTYTTNDVLVRVSGPDSDSPRGFPKYTHRFGTGKSHFVGSFLNFGTPQNGLPSARVNELSVFFSEDVPLLVQMNLSSSGGLSTRRVFYSNNGFGFWSRVLLTATLKDTDSLLRKLDAENKSLVSTNDKYVVDVLMKSDYLSVGKLLKVAKQQLSEDLSAYTMYQHNKKDSSAFKFQKLVTVGKDVATEGLEELTGVTSAKVYWFLDTPVLVHLAGSTKVPASQVTPVNPLPSQSQLPQAPGSAVGVGGAGQPGVPGAAQSGGRGGDVSAPGVGVGGAGLPVTSLRTSPVAQSTVNNPFNHYYSFNGDTKKWVRVGNTEVGNGQPAALKPVLDKAKATLGSVTLQLGHGVGSYKSGPVTVTVTNTTSKSKYGRGVFDMMTHTMSAPFPLGKLKHFDFDVKLTEVAPEQRTTGVPAEVPYQLGFNAVRMEVYVYKYVPLLVGLLTEGDSTVFFANSLSESKWKRFTFEVDTKIGEKLEELRANLTTVSSLDVCKKHEAQTPAAYTLKQAVGTGNVQVALSRLEGLSGGMSGVLHTLPTAQKLGSLTCGDEVLTGLDFGNVNKVAVYFKGQVPAVVKANSTPKYFTLNPSGGLSRHVLPQGATDLNAQQVTDLVTTVANNMGSVLEFNMEMRNNYNVATSGLQMKVAHAPLGATWSLYTHTLGDNNETFTVSKFMKGMKDVVGLPHNKLLSAVYVGFKGNEPMLVGLKTVGLSVYEWYVFDKHRWLFDFNTETLLEDDEVVAVLEDVDDGLENEFSLDLALESTPDMFAFDHHNYTDTNLVGFARNTYTVADVKYPFLLGALRYNSEVLTATDLATHHLSSLTSYTYKNEPVLLHALTFDKKSLFFETNFSGLFSPVDLGEFNEQVLKARLGNLKAKAANLVTVELTAKQPYKNYDANVQVAKKDESTLQSFEKFEHKLPDTTTPAPNQATNPTPFTFRKVKYNNTVLELTLPAGTVTSVNTFLASDGLPVGFHFLLTPLPAAASSRVQSTGPVAPQSPAPAAATPMNHYFFHKAGKWEPTTSATGLTPEALKQKLVEAENTLVGRVTVDLANKVTHTVWTRVENADGSELTGDAAAQAQASTKTTKTLNFLVEANPKEVSRMKAYTHVPQMKVVKGTANPTTSELAPFVAGFNLGDHKLIGFEMNKVDKFTVFWIDDTHPVMVLLKTPTAYKFYRYSHGYEWVMVKSVGDVPSEELMFEMATLARNAFTYKASVDLGADTGLGTAFKYTSGQLTMRVLDAGMLGTNYKVFKHASTSVFAPVFRLKELNLFGVLGLRPSNDLGFVHEVKVFANLDKFPLLAEVAATNFRHPRAPLKYHYYMFNKALGATTTGGEAGTVTPLLFVKSVDVKLSEKELLLLLEPLDAVRENTFVVKLDAKAAYNPKPDVTFNVARSVQASGVEKFDVYDHTFPDAPAGAAAPPVKKTLVLMVGDKKVGFVTKEVGFKLVTVHWLNGVPVHAALKFFPNNEQLNYYFLGGEHWSSTLKFEPNFSYTDRTAFFEKVNPHYAFKDLDFGNKTLKTQFGKLTNIELDDYKPDGLKFPEGLVGYSFKLGSAGHDVVKMLNFGWDFDALELKLPSGKVKEVKVFSPESFYAPVFVEVKSNVVVRPAAGEAGGEAQTKDVYRYFHVTSSGFWTGLNTKDEKLTNEVLALRLAKVAFPVPALVDLGKREGTYGLPRMLVEKKFFSTAHNYAKYEHKLAVGENFLLTRWVFGGLQMDELPVLEADHVAAYFYEDAVPLLLEVNSAGLVKFFSPDANGRWMPENVARTAVSAFLDNLVHEVSLVARHSQEWVPHLNTKFLREMELVPEPKVVAARDASTAAAAASRGPAEPQLTSTRASPVSSAGDSRQPANLHGAQVGQGVDRAASGAGGVGVAGRAGSLAPENVVPPVKAKREFKPAPFNYEDLFHGYMTMGKFVKVARFDTVPNGYDFGKHSFVNGGKYYANKFLLGGKEYAFPADDTDTNMSRLANSLSLYSWSGDPLLLKLGLQSKEPVFFSYNKTNDTWAKAKVVNLDEELEHLNNLNGMYVFDLGKPNGRHKYYNNKSYYVSNGPELLPELFKSAEFETFTLLQNKVENTHLEQHERVKFKLGKLRLNGVDLPSDGLPADKQFYFLHVFTSKSSNKPLLLVFYEDIDEKGRKKFEAANPGKFLGHYYHWNLDGTWSKFSPEGVDAVTNKLKELEAMFAVPLTLDLAKVTGTAGFLNYKSNGNEFVVERVFMPVVRGAQEAPRREPGPGDREFDSAVSMGGLGFREGPGPMGAHPGVRVVQEPSVQARVTLSTGDVTSLPPKPQATAHSGQHVADPAGFTLVNRGVTPTRDTRTALPPVAGRSPPSGEGRFLTQGLPQGSQGGVPDTDPNRIRGAGLPSSGNGANSDTLLRPAVAPNTGGLGVGGTGVPGQAGGLGPAGTQHTQVVGVPGAPGQHGVSQASASGRPNTVTLTTSSGDVRTNVSTHGGAGHPSSVPGPTGSGVSQGTRPASGLPAATPLAGHGSGVGPRPGSAELSGPSAGVGPPVQPELQLTPVVADTSHLRVLPEVATLPQGSFVDVAFVSHSGPVSATEAEAGFELYHHHAPFFVHSFTEQGRTEPRKVVKAKKFNVKKVTYGGVELDFSAPFQPLEGGYAGMTVFYEKNAKTPFLFALFTLKNNQAGTPNVHYDVWVHRNLKWVKTEELDQFYMLMRSLELKNDLGPMANLMPVFSEKLAELAAAARAMLPNVFSLDLKQDDTMRFGSVVVDKDADVVRGLEMLKQEFKPRMLSTPAGWVDFSLDSVSLHGNRYVGLKLPMVGVHAVNTYFRNSPDRYARFPAVMELVQKLKGHNKPVFKHWFYLYVGANEWRLHFHTEDKLDDHDVFDMLNAHVYEYHRVSEFHKGAIMLDLDTKFSHVSMGRFVDAMEFFHDPASTNSPVPEGFLLYRHTMTTENTTFTLPFFKLQGDVKETGFKFPFAQYFLYFKVGHNVPFVVVLAQKDNLTGQPTHHWYYVKGHDLVKFKFSVTTDVDPDDHRNKAVVTAKFQELLLAAPTPLTEADALKADPPEGTVMPTFPASHEKVFSKPVNGVGSEEAPPGAPAQTGYQGVGVLTGPGVIELSLAPGDPLPKPGKTRASSSRVVGANRDNGFRLEDALETGPDGQTRNSGRAGSSGNTHTDTQRTVTNGDLARPSDRDSQLNSDFGVSDWF
ncbi:hypothetical protein MACJ_001536 [Theileria orientalis]|uniref:Uncharacterized protein n=1 Tax=Theileria orientalis TaxID=68886 RepID=A0A976QTT6_THEOR|nr:hypothetical protein MACJ_001536 [Theileria orientalis]